MYIHMFDLLANKAVCIDVIDVGSIVEGFAGGDPLKVDGTTNDRAEPILFTWLGSSDASVGSAVCAPL
jgi:hypothetical protein